MELFVALTSQEAESLIGGAGIGPVVSGTIQTLKDLGIKPKDAAIASGFKNFGDAVSNYAQAVNGPA